MLTLNHLYYPLLQGRVLITLIICLFPFHKVSAQEEPKEPRATLKWNNNNNNNNNNSKFIGQTATYEINKIFTDCIGFFYKYMKWIN